jgi:3-hydroxyisobutyrate dehydrogenase-like beta-hydroxyacid dehydrogenase
VKPFDHVCLIGFGEVGQILAADLAKAGVSDIAVFDIAFHDTGSRPSRALVGSAAHGAASAAEAARGAQLILSAVTAAQDFVAAGSVAPGLAAGALYVDLNSASPGQKQASAATVEAAGGRFVEAAVMSPFPPRRLASPILLGGVAATEFKTRAAPLGFTGTQVFSDRIGPASATKMCRSVVIKGVEALLVESMLAARRHGVEDQVLASLSDLLPVPDWPGLARYMISRALEHGARRAEEMQEAAHTMGEAGIEPLMSRATAERQAWAANFRGAAGEMRLGAMLDSILKTMAEPR